MFGKLQKFCLNHRHGVTITAILLAVAGLITAFILPAVLQSRRIAAWNRERAVNLFHLGHALHNYLDQDNHMCSQAICSASSQPLLSWRVALLPFFDDPKIRKLHEQFHLNESWDSPHNRQLVEKMPHVFESPGAEAIPGHTYFQALVSAPEYLRGKYRPVWRIQSAQSLRLADLLGNDGTINTVLLIEASRAIPWTKPEDIIIDDTMDNLEKPLGFGLGSTGYSQRSGQCQACMVDGSIRTLLTFPENPRKLKRLLRSVIGYQDGEVVSDEIYADLQPETQKGTVVFEKQKEREKLPRPIMKK
jgi:hypothetical protein